MQPDLPAWRKDGPLLLGLILFALLIRCYCLSLPYERYFDEIYYPNAAVNYLQGEKDENHVHPPGSKLFMAAFMETWWGVERFVLHNFQPHGISTISWRLGSLVLGLVVIGMTYYLALAMFKNRLVAFLAGFFISIDMLHIVQCRIAMIDMYEAFWIMLGLVCTWHFIKAPENQMKWAWLAAIAFGCGMATKWSTMFAMVGALAAVFWLKDPEKLNGNGGSSEPDEEHGWLRIGLRSMLRRKVHGNPWLVRLLDTADVLVIGLLMTAVIYTCAFIPLLRTNIRLARTVPVTADHAVQAGFDQTWKDVKFYHVQMWTFRHDPKQFKHRYLSTWWQWPTCYRPIWYIYHESDSPNYSIFANWVQKEWFLKLFGPMSGPENKWVYGAICIGSVWTWLFFLLFLFVVLIRMLLSGYFLISSRCYTRPPPTDPEERLSWDEWRESWQTGDEKGLAFCVLVYLPQVLFWGINPGFMFYMLPVVPFMCIITAHTVADWREMKIGRVVMGIFIFVSVVWVVVYYPLIIGYPIPKPYFEHLMLIRNWI